MKSTKQEKALIFNKQKAFSLVEMSIVILIISLIIVGIIKGSDIVKTARLNTARSLTEKSPVKLISDLAVWFETTSEKSFLTTNDDTKISDATAIANWYDINPQINQKSDLSQNSNSNWRPTYRTAQINSLPTLRFDGSNDFLAVSSTSVYASSPISNNFSIFVVAKPNNTISVVSEANSGIWGLSGQRYLLWPNLCSSSSCGQAGISFGTNAIAVFEHGGSYLPALLFYQGIFNKDGTIINVNYSIKSGNSRTSSSLYLNGNFVKNSLVSTRNTITPPRNIGGQPAAYGFFSGDVGEVIIFARSITDEERDAVNSYLKQKWEIN